MNNLNHNFRNYNLTDNVVEFIDTGLRTLFGKPITTERPNPADKIINISKNDELKDTEKQHAAGLMRINHCGEVCAQALYQGQAITASNPSIKAKLRQAAFEENDHLAWCESRLNQLNSHTSYLNPLWYTGSLLLGITAGIAGDKWNLGFLAETENQVSKHLASHLNKLPENDYKSRAIVEQMKIDEEQHEHLAIESGAAELPDLIKYTMRFTAKLMTTVTYYY